MTNRLSDFFQRWLRMIDTYSVPDSPRIPHHD
ncbi:hypothetical protein EES43_01275 [Streptomyces sp. ADI96-02]|nr:hypothetical protein EES43_01275 [Streptomyces sp. ADI96-02]